MVTGNKTHRKTPTIVGLSLLLFIFLSSFTYSQTDANQRIELSDIVIVNILNGIQSENYGVKMSCIYFAGKYRIIDVSEDLVMEMKKSDNDELCQMLVWSLYQIGDEKCCQELKSIIENHPSEKIRDFCKYLHNIKEYESAIAKY